MIRRWFGASEPAPPANRDPSSDYWYSPVAADGQVVVNATTVPQIPEVYDCLQIIAQTIASLPLITYRREKNGSKTRVDQHPIADLLHHRPNPRTTAYEWRHQMTWDLCLHRNAFAEIREGRRGVVDELVRIDPTTVWIVKAGGEYVYEVRDGAIRRRLDREEVFHLRAPPLTSDNILGRSLIQDGHKTFARALALQDFATRFFENDATPGGIVEVPGKFATVDQAKEYRQKWQALFSGRNRHKIGVLDNGAKFNKIDIQNDKAQFIETYREVALQCLRFWRMPPHKVGILDKATFCLPATTHVYTRSGPVRIADIVVGDEVWSRAEDGSFKLSKVVRSACTGTDEILVLKTTNRTLRCNARHRVLVRRCREVPLTPGQIGGRNAAPGQKVRLDWVTEYVPAGELKVGDCLVAAHGLPDLSGTRAPTRDVSVGFMEFIGLYIGDGSMGRTSDGHRNSVSIARRSGAPYMDHYREVIAREFRAYDGGNGRGCRSIVPTKKVTLQEAARYTRFSSRLAAQELIDIGCGGKASEKRVPGWVFGLSEDLRLAFLRGYLDADGSVDKKGRISFHSVSRDLLDGVRHLCIGLGIPVTNLRNQRGTTRLPNGKIAPVDVWSFTCSDPGQNQRIGSHTPDYIARLEVGQAFGRKDRKYPRNGGGGDFVEPHAKLAKIVDISAELAEPVYDLEVAETHSFIADGVVVHNSNIEQQALEFVTDTLMPWLVAWEQAIRRDLIVHDDVFFAEHNVAGLLRGDIKARYEAYRIGREWGWLSADDVRGMENMNPLGPGVGDVYLQPLNMAPAGSTPAQRAAYAAFVDREVALYANHRKLIEASADALR